MIAAAIVTIFGIILIAAATVTVFGNNSSCYDPQPWELRPSGPGYHGCGSIKGNREKFPKRKEKKRKRRDFLTHEYTFYW